MPLTKVATTADNVRVNDRFKVAAAMFRVEEVVLMSHNLVFFEASNAAAPEVSSLRLTVKRDQPMDIYTPRY